MTDPAHKNERRWYPATACHRQPEYLQSTHAKTQKPGQARLFAFLIPHVVRQPLRARRVAYRPKPINTTDSNTATTTPGKGKRPMVKNSNVNVITAEPPAKAPEA